MEEELNEREFTLSVAADDTLATATMKLVLTYLQKNQLSPEGVPALISAVSESLKPLFGSQMPQPVVQPEVLNEPHTHMHMHVKPAVAIDVSVESDLITCLEDGHKFKSLKRHLRTAHGMTPEEYRKKWKLPDDYPMVAPDYAKRRSELAKEFAFRERPENNGEPSGSDD